MNRFYIQIRTELGIDYKTIFHELKSVRPDEAPSLMTVFNWFKHFKQGNQRLEDKQRSGCPITETIKDNIERVRTLIEEGPWCTYDEIEAETSLSRGTIHTIIHDHLKKKKITSR